VAYFPGYSYVTVSFHAITKKKQLYPNSLNLVHTKILQHHG